MCASSTSRRSVSSDRTVVSRSSLPSRWRSEKGEGGRLTINEIPDSEFEIDADLVLLAMGFIGPEKEGLLSQLGVGLTERGNVRTDTTKMTSIPGVFAAGDMVRGQSLIVWAIQEGREAARGIDEYLMGSTELP